MNERWHGDSITRISGIACFILTAFIALPLFIFSVNPVYAQAPTPVYKPGDANHDGMVDESDYKIWLAHFRQTVTGGASVGDFDNNGRVDGVDYMIWLINYSIFGYLRIFLM